MANVSFLEGTRTVDKLVDAAPSGLKWRLVHRLLRCYDSLEELWRAIKQSADQRPSEELVNKLDESRRQFLRIAREGRNERSATYEVALSEYSRKYCAMYDGDMNRRKEVLSYNEIIVSGELQRRVNEN